MKKRNYKNVKNEIPPFQYVIDLQLKNIFFKLFCILSSNKNLIKKYFRRNYEKIN